MSIAKTPWCAGTVGGRGERGFFEKEYDDVDWKTAEAWNR